MLGLRMGGHIVYVVMVWGQEWRDKSVCVLLSFLLWGKRKKGKLAHGALCSTRSPRLNWFFLVVPAKV